MKRNLIVANTYFQLITAINLTINNLNDCTNDLVFTDISVGAEKKVERLKDLKIFRNIYFIRYKALNSGSKVKKYMKYLFKRGELLKDPFDEKYDELIFYNLDIITYSLIDQLYKNNKKLLCSRYDEGFGTYTINLKSNNINNTLRFILGRVNINRLIKKIYLYHPNLLCYKCNYEKVQIPCLSKNDSKLKEILNYIFEYKKIPFPQRYIFFEEVFDCKDINDYELVLKIANLVGKENIIIKLHPRNKENRFDKTGIRTLENVGIPWEIIQMNENYSDKIFLAISSSTLFASRLYFNEQIKSFYLFNCTNKMPILVTDKYLNYIKKIDSSIGLKNIIIPNSSEELFKYLEKEKENYKI